MARVSPTMTMSLNRLLTVYVLVTWACSECRSRKCEVSIFHKQIDEKLIEGLYCRFVTKEN